MGQPVIVPRNEGEIIADAPDRHIEILSDHDSLNATWSRYGPRREGADLHVHRQHTDLFYVLDGEFTLRLGIDDKPVVAGPGTLVRIPPMVVHGFRNGSDGETRYLNFHAPGRRFADYMRAIRDRREFSYDQFPPPSEGIRSPEEATIGGHEFVSEHPGLRVALLADVDDIAVCVTQADAGMSPVPRHVHNRHNESFYVVEGAIAFEVGDLDVVAEAGAWVQVPPGVPHSFAVFDDRPTQWVNVHTPTAGFGGFLRALLNGDSNPVAASGFDQEPA